MIKSAVESKISEVKTTPVEPVSIPKIEDGFEMGETNPTAGRPVNLDNIRRRIKNERKR